MSRAFLLRPVKTDVQHLRREKEMPEGDQSLNSASGHYESIWTALIETEFRQFYVEAEGVRTRVMEAGSPAHPTVVMLHGTAGSWETFCRNIGPLSARYHCIAFDMIGSGFSEKPDRPYEITTYAQHVLAVMRALGVPRASILGVSLGAWVACRFALMNPELVDKLLLVAPTGFVSNAANMERIKSRRTKAVEDPSWENIRTIIRNLLFDEKSCLPDLIAVRQASYQKPEMLTAMNNVLVLQDPDIRARNVLSEEEWRSLSVPTLIALSVDVQDSYYENSVRLADVMPNAKLVEFPKVNHWAHFEDAARFNAEALAFLGE